MPVLKAGARLRSQVDTTEIIVVRAPADDVDVRIGGHPAIEVGAQPHAGLALDPSAGEPALLGKRYTRDAGDVELLVTKAGTAALSIGATPLVVKESKPLPASD
jgi:hypothetical protein